MKILILSVFLCGALSTAFAGSPVPMLDFAPSMVPAKADESKLTATERRLAGVVIPEIDFRQANLDDVTEFFDQAVSQFGTGLETNNTTRMHIQLDPSGRGEDVPLITLAIRNTPLLHAIIMTTDVGLLDYRIEGSTVTIFKP